MSSKHEYLENIYYGAAGLLDNEPETEPTKTKDYSVLGDYRISNYQEQPHVYADRHRHRMSGIIHNKQEGLYT